MNFLVYKRKLEGDLIYINPDNFIRLVKSKNRLLVKYKWAATNYEPEEIDSEYGLKLVNKLIDEEFLTF